VKLEPMQGWANGRTAITRAARQIIVLNQAQKITRYLLIEQVSPEAEKAGFHVGDFVVVKMMYDMFFNATNGKTVHLVTFPVTEVIQKVHDLDVSQLVGIDGEPFELKVEIAA